jgi:hypothetical protein
VPAPLLRREPSAPIWRVWRASDFPVLPMRALLIMAPMSEDPVLVRKGGYAWSRCQTPSRRL